jgi:hypothetical protein
MNPPQLPATENVTLTMTSPNMCILVGYSLISQTLYIHFWRQYCASEFMKPYNETGERYVLTHIDKFPCMGECHTVCTNSEQTVKNIRFWFHNVYSTSHTKLHTQVHNDTVSLLHVSAFFDHPQGGIQQWKTQHSLTMPQMCNCRLKNKIDVEFV